MTQRDDKFRVRNGFFTRPIPSHTRDALRRPRDEMEEEEPDDETLEIHNHIPISYPEPADYDRDRARDDEEPEGRSDEGRGGPYGRSEVVARFPANGFSAVTEGNEIVVYRGSPDHRSDRYEMGGGETTHDNRPRPPRTLAQLNRLHAAHYGRKGAR